MTNVEFKNQSSEFDLNNQFNHLSILCLFPAILPTLPQKEQQDDIDALSLLGNINSLKKMFRVFSMKPLPHKNIDKINNQCRDSQKIVFCPYFHSQFCQQKKFWAIEYGVKDGLKLKLQLNDPKIALILPRNLIVAIERSALTLYKIINGQMNLIDYDIQLPKNINIFDMKYTTYSHKQYLFLFGHQWVNNQSTILKCLIYQIHHQMFKYVKQTMLYDCQINNPIILFDQYHENINQKFMLICGGINYRLNTYFYSAIQISLALLLNDKIEYNYLNGKKINFTHQQNISSGKAIKFNNYWYLFCTKTQQISQLQFHSSNKNIMNEIEIISKPLNFIDNINFTEDNLHIIEKNNQFYLIMIDEHLKFKFKNFNTINCKFKKY